MRSPKLVYTQIPNIFIDDWVHNIDPMEAKVMLIIYRKTFGWHKDRDQISISQLEKCTGHGKQAILKAVNGLIEKGAIRKIVEGPNGQQKTYYEVVMEEDSNNSDPCDFHTGDKNSNNLDQCDSHTPPQCDFHTGTSVKITPTKETSTKEKVVCYSGAEAPANGPPSQGAVVSKEETPRWTTKTTTAGNEITVNRDEIITYSIRLKKDWRMTEINEAWEILCAYKGAVNDGVAFIEGTIRNIRNGVRSAKACKSKYREKTCDTKHQNKEINDSKQTSSQNKEPSSEKGSTGSPFPPLRERLRQKFPDGWKPHGAS